MGSCFVSFFSIFLLPFRWIFLCLTWHRNQLCKFECWFFLHLSYLNKSNWTVFFSFLHLNSLSFLFVCCCGWLFFSLHFLCNRHKMALAHFDCVSNQIIWIGIKNCWTETQQFWRRRKKKRDHSCAYIHTCASTAWRKASIHKGCWLSHFSRVRNKSIG